MNKVEFIVPVKLRKSTNLLKLAKKAGIEINAPCKKGKCQKCLVMVEGDVSPITKKERKTFTEEELAKGCRLACEVEVRGACKITVAPV